MFNSFIVNVKGITGEIVYKNNHVNNIYEACTCCYDNTKPITYEEKKEYIGKRITAGHESILEHGRLAIKISGITDTEQIAELTTLDYSKWLEFYSVHKENDEWILIVNGNMRSYKHFFTNTTEDDYERNVLIRIIHTILLNNTVGELYGDTFEMYDDKPEFVEIEAFTDIMENDIDTVLSAHAGIEYDTVTTREVKTPITNKPDSKKSVTVGFDKLQILEIDSDPDISFDVAINIIPITVLFTNMSRTATHQLVRHRNAITQESQRYVSAKNASFTIPVQNYEEDKKYKISLFGVIKEVSLTELANELHSVYEQLTNSGMKKEEARGFLPSNTNCNRLYMTFTMASLKAFFNLRLDPHAQYEIRQYATEIFKIYDESFPINTTNTSTTIAEEEV
jgi:flavin-dependent thymidylate synthase